MKSLLVGLLVIVAACGEGRAIFNIDAQSFMQGTGKDTIPYAIPPASSGTVSTFQRINLPPGFGSSGVDSVRITAGNITLLNSAGQGTVGFTLYFAADSAGTTTATAALSIPATPLVFTRPLNGARNTDQEREMARRSREPDSPGLPLITSVPKASA